MAYFFIIGGFTLEMLVWIIGEILEMFIYLFIGELSDSRQVIQHYIPCYFIKPKFEKSI